MILQAGDRGFDWFHYLNQFGLVEKPPKRRKKQKQEIVNVISAFDIETSTVWLNPNKELYDVHSFMYIWQLQIEEHTVIGRTWEEFLSFMQLLKSALAKIKFARGLDDLPMMVLWVHNLQYEFAFLSGIYTFQNEDCFFRKERKPLYCRMMGCFEFRCSYLQTNLSLAALCKQMGVPAKLSGQKYDYDKIRYPWTILSDYELEYCITDVQSLVLAMKKRIIKGGDTLYTVPMTSTGYVRRECKEALSGRYLEMRDLKPGPEMYTLLRKAFRGGDTHANRFQVGKIIEDVYSYDISSSYPTQQLTHLFPMRPFKWLDLEGISAAERMKRVYNYMGLGYAVVGTYQFKKLRLKDARNPMPYISLSRCEAEYTRGYKLDNGRILSAGYVEISCTEIDLEIILKEYTYDTIDCIEAMVSYKDLLPYPYREVIMKYYTNKTSLKGDDTEEGKYTYMKSKEMINAIYGMSATDPVHAEIIYDPEHKLEQTPEDSDYYVPGKARTRDELIKILKDAPFPYQWGVYTTALARYQLRQAMYTCYRQGKKEDVLYCDTDSIKVRGKVNFDKLNKQLREQAIQKNAFADDMHGVRHYIGVFEDEGKGKGACYDEFITQGAKRYAYIKDGKMGITVSGVTKKINEETGIPFAVEELGSLKNFKPDKMDENGNVIEEGMIWKKAGGSMSIFNDHADRWYTDPETGRAVHITKNIAIIPTTYKMTYAKDYRLLLGEIDLYTTFKEAHE